MDECNIYIGEDTEWEVVGIDEAHHDRNLSAGSASASAHFEIKLVWGEWKHKICSFDFTRTTEPAHDSDEDDAASKEKEEDDQKGTRAEDS
jgi:hypothetical protein